MGVTAIIIFDHNFTALLESSVFVTMIIAYFLWPKAIVAREPMQMELWSKDCAKPVI